MIAVISNCHVIPVVANAEIASEKPIGTPQIIMPRKSPISKSAFCNTMIYLLPQTFGSLAFSAPTVCPDNLFKFVFTMWKRDMTQPIGKGI